MKKIIGLIILLTVSLSTLSCVSTREHNELKAGYDSLTVAHAHLDSSMTMLVSYLDTLTSCIDSISAQEGVSRLTMTESGRTLSRYEKARNLDDLASLVERQRERIKALETQIAENGQDILNLKTLITNLYAQLDEKDAEISRMKQELVNQQRVIAELNSTVETLNVTVDEQNAEINEKSGIIESQQKTLEQQDNSLNTGYVLIGKRKDLQRMGLLGAVGNKINPTAINKDNFHAVDIREFTYASVGGKGVKILTPMPSESYETSFDGVSTAITITDPTLFWSKSRYLIVLIN